jgi:PKD repeat protein
MDQMKKLLSLLLMFSLAITFAIAQQPYVTLKGHVVNQETGTPVAGQTMYISVDSSNYPGYYNQVITDETGYYSDQIPVMPGTMPGIIIVSTSSCNGTMVSATATFIPGIPEVILDFSICAIPTQGCMASFKPFPSSNDLLMFSFIDNSIAMPGSTISSWAWDFGDGTASSEQNPVHTYARPGLYNVCLFISSNDSLCSSNYCMPVEAGSTIPGPCENSFWYQPDSGGTGYIFEGWVLNGQAYSWTWDFGDGTTATGQTVSHSFADPNTSYTVCLTTTGAGPDSTTCTAVSCQDVIIYIPSPCESNFWYYPDSTGSGYIFEGWSQNNQMDSWVWDFGDGTSAIGQTVSHSYAGTNVTYTVCLTTAGTGPDGTACTSVSCQDVFIYMPAPCESSFWYSNDSTGTAFTFEGWAQNNQIISWNWDFGDGTTANGQTVSHVFAGTNTQYNVCLTTTGIGADGVACTYVSCQQVYIYIPSPCENYFKAYSNDGTTYSFTGQLISGGLAYYSWDFGDGTTANGQQVTHTFTFGNSGTIFNVCLKTIAIDPATNDTCLSTSCQLIFPGGTGSSCEAIMSAIPDSSQYTYYFKDLSLGNHSFVSWDFGDGQLSNEANPVHTYSLPGMYWACLTIADSMNDCWNQTCQEIWVNSIQPGCQASFIAFPADSVATSLSYMFINTSAPGYYKQAWMFGDGSTSSEANPLHTYASPGIYNACLTIWDSTGICQNTYCLEIFAGGVNGNYTVSGVVLAGNTPADKGIVWIIGAGNYYYAETLIDSGGTYHFGNVPEGSYYIYAMLTPDSPNFFGYMPSYYANSLTWQGATIITTGEPNAWYPINLVPSMYWSQGNASITGSISWGGTFKSGGSPAANVEIVLFNSTGAPIAYTFSQSDGTFEFNNLPYGEYTLHAEMTGKITEAIVVILSENFSITNITFIVTGEAISALGSNDPATPKLVAGNPYPNPAGEMLYLDLNAPAPGTTVVDIIDLQGRIIRSESLIISGGSNRISMETGELTKGMYLLRISTEGREPVQRRFIK